MSSNANKLSKAIALSFPSPHQSTPMTRKKRMIIRDKVVNRIKDKVTFDQEGQVLIDEKVLGSVYRACVLDEFGSSTTNAPEWLKVSLQLKGFTAPKKATWSAHREEKYSVDRVDWSEVFSQKERAG